MNWNQQTNHMMVDLETLGLTSDAIVISAAAIVFNSTEIVAGYYEEFNWNQADTTIDPATIQFWMKQVSEGKPIPMGTSDPAQLPIALNRLYKDHACETIWAQGTDFDIPMIKFRFNQLSMDVPWKYNAVRDCRTMFKVFEAIADNAKVENLNRHDAFNDATFQVKKLQHVINELTYLGVHI